MNTVVNVAVLLFLGYALLGPGPLGMKIREYTAAREARMAVRDVFARLRQRAVGTTQAHG